jgi:hypothetical protein
MRLGVAIKYLSRIGEGYRSHWVKLSDVFLTQKKMYEGKFRSSSISPPSSRRCQAVSKIVEADKNQSEKKPYTYELFSTVD